MTAIPEPENTIRSLIYRAYEDKQEPPRYHLGASLLGHPCDLWLWLSFRWAVQERFQGRILRLFLRGQNEEAQVVADLESIGCNVKFTGKEQMRVDFGCHISGSLDGIVDRVPEAPKTRHVLEIKTHSLKSFSSLLKDGVEKSKPMHYAQMQVYMHGTDSKRALYFAVCKDNDEIYTERVRYDKDVAEKYIERGKWIALSDRAPAPVSTRADWWECKLCAGYQFCHVERLTKQVNCRTCARSTAHADSTFSCEKWGSTIPKEAQLAGCAYHVLHPDLVPWKMVDSGLDDVGAYEIDGQVVFNGFGFVPSLELVKDAT